VNAMLRLAAAAVIASVVVVASGGGAVAAEMSAADSTIRLPAVTGSYGVGTFTALWTDSARSDTTDQGARPRSVGIQVWYPASPSAANPLAAYASGVDTSASEYGRLMARVRGHAAWMPPFAVGLRRAPVAVLSTGRSMAAYDYSAIAEDLASHGYVVVGVNSPHLSRFFTAEGGAVPPAPAPSLKVLQHFDEADEFFEPMIREVAADLRFVVRRLVLANRSDRTLAGHLDLGRLAMMGHSNGALAASRACAEDGHCRACLGIEGTQAREIRKNGVGKPYGLLISDQSLGYDAENVYRELGSHVGTSYTVIIVNGAGHNSSTDLLLVRPTLFQYRLDPGRGVDIARAAIRAFLDDKLLGRAGVDVKAALARYPEVEVQKSFPQTPQGAAR